MDHTRTHHLSVFPAGHLAPSAQGGNPTTIVLGADELTDAQMQALAGKEAHECGFVGPGTKTGHDFVMRYYVPGHEMEMCGHATVGAVWVMHELGVLPRGKERVTISTRSGGVEAWIVSGGGGEPSIRVSQPIGSVEELGIGGIEQIVECLGISAEDLAKGRKVQNGRTSRTKTLIPIQSREVLDSLRPGQASVRRVCEAIGSTGLYPYAVLDEGKQLVEARQFPKSSGYLEDPATGIAAAALTFGLLDNGVVSSESVEPVVVRQGWSMGKPSEIQVYLRNEGGELAGCWISGSVKWLASK